MKKAKQCSVIVAICLVIILCVQFAVYLILTGKVFYENKKNENGSVIRIFLHTAQISNFQVFPFDLHILESFVGSGNFSSLCSHFCDSKFLAFATFEESLTNKQHFISRLVEEGFQHTAIFEYDEKMLVHDVKIKVNLHHLFSKNNHYFRLTILFRRDDNFLWHGRFNGSAFQLQNRISFDLANTEGAYDNFAVSPIAVDGIKLYLPSNISNFMLQAADSTFVGCNHTRAKLFHKLYGFDSSEDAAQFKTIAWKMLSLASSALKKLKVKFWLSSGTCLGFFRQCDIFPHGRDVDIGIRITDYNKLIVPTLVSTGMKLKHIFGKVEDSLELSFIYSGIKLDIFFFYEEANHVWNGGLQAKSGRKFKYIFPKFDLCWTEFLGLKVRIPCQTQIYIEANYGPNWFHPVYEWDWKSSPFNVHSNGQWPEEEWPEVIQQMGM